MSGQITFGGAQTVCTGHAEDSRVPASPQNAGFRYRLSAPKTADRSGGGLCGVIAVVGQFGHLWSLVRSAIGLYLPQLQRWDYQQNVIETKNK